MRHHGDVDAKRSAHDALRVVRKRTLPEQDSEHDHRASEHVAPSGVVGHDRRKRIHANLGKNRHHRAHQGQHRTDPEPGASL